MWPTLNLPKPTLVARGCAAVSVIGFLYALVTGLELRQQNRNLIKEGLQSVRALADQSQARMQGSLERVTATIDDVGKNLLKGERPDESQILATMRDVMYSNSDFVEAGVAFAPFAYDRHIRLYGLSYRVDAQGMHFRDLDVDQDYTKVGTDWYRRPLAGKAVWLEPRYDAARRQTLATYAAPLIKHGDAAEPAGVVYATYAVSRFQRVLDALDLGENGYGFLISPSQRFILHPNKNYIDQRLDMNDFLDRLESRSAAQAVKAALRDASQTAPFTDPNTGLDSRVFFRWIPSSAWTLGVVLADRDLILPPSAARKTLIHQALAVGAAIILMTVAFCGVVHGSSRGIWVLSSVIAACCILTTGFILWLAQDQPPSGNSDSIRITNQNILNRFMAEQRRRTLEQRQEVPLFVPTGIHVQSISFETGDDVRMTGYVWQRYTQGIHDDIERGFVMPESRSLEVGTPYATRAGNTELLRWNFKATLDRHFDYSRYPFGKEYVRVQLWNKEFTRNVILVPDLESYKLINPAAHPGLPEDLLLSGWNIKDSFFDYRLQNYKSSFGLGDYSGLTDFPELFFNIGVEKQITGLFVANILPLMVVFILLFGVLFLATTEGGQKGLLSFTLDVILACGAFFLVAIFSHIAMRNSVAARDIFYLEYYYFVTYAMILFTAMNYVHLTKTPIGLLRFRENLIPKVVFWPASLLAILVLTLKEFY